MQDHTSYHNGDLPAGSASRRPSLPWHPASSLCFPSCNFLCQEAALATARSSPLPPTSFVYAYRVVNVKLVEPSPAPLTGLVFPGHTQQPDKPLSDNTRHTAFTVPAHICLPPRFPASWGCSVCPEHAGWAQGKHQQAHFKKWVNGKS